MSITISHPAGVLQGNIKLPYSKSESNRILILQALSNGMIAAKNLSDARDTSLLHTALAARQVETDIKDAGTAMRFLTAYYCAVNQHKILTGSDRMRERPIGILVEALKDIGFNITYLKREGFPPLEITPTDLATLKMEVKIAGNVSSQYISALMMIAPVLKDGLRISLTSSLASEPYVSLTAALMLKAGIVCEIEKDMIYIPSQTFARSTLSATADWSAASYWFSMASVSKGAEIFLENLSINSHQGDRQIAEWAKHFHVKSKQGHNSLSLICNDSSHSEDTALHPSFFSNPTDPENPGLHSSHPENPGLYSSHPENPGLHSSHPENPGLYSSHPENPGLHSPHPENPGLHFDFTHYPDLAQTVIVLCAAKNIKATFSGLQSLRIKETDRIAALQNELAKFGVKLEEYLEGKFQLEGSFTMSYQTIKTYNDHRMAMAFAPLSLLGRITIEHPEVVEKSYPGFWKEMKNLGFEIV
jgi:3-phosphoshikimate 1-carboxyvinyltransferase